MIPIENIEVKTAAGKCAAFLSPKSDALKECYADCRLNGESTLEFLIPATSEKIVELTPECQIWTPERVYTLLKDEAIDTVRDEKNKLWAKFMAIERWAELDSQYPEPYITNDPLIPTPSDLAVIIVGGGSDLTGGRYAVGTAAHALYAVLQGSGWTLGTVDVTGTHDLEMEKVSRLQLIKEIQNIWGGYLVWDSVNKTVSLRDANTWQNYTGFNIMYAKNLKHITRTQSNRLVTKLYAFGHDDLDISSVNGGKKYLTNNTFSPYVHTGIYKNQDIYNAQELKEKAAAELELICRPKYLYRVKMVDLRTLPEYSHEDFAVGDMVDVIDPDVAPESPRPRLIRHKYNLFQPWKCEIEIGDPQERLAELLKASFSTTDFIGGKYKGNGQMSGYSIEDLTIEDVKIKSLTADKITAGTIDAEVIDVVNLNADNITAGTLTGITVQTGKTGARMILNANGLSSYNSSNLLHGLQCDPCYTYPEITLYRNGSEVFGAKTMNDGSLSLDGKGHTIFYSDGYTVETVQDFDFSLSTVTGLDNYALASHDHDNRYVKTGGSQNLKLQSFEGAEVNYVEVWLGSTYLGKVDLY